MDLTSLLSGGTPVLMGIVNATPDSFSDRGLYTDDQSRLQQASELIAAGAKIIDVGGESGITDGKVLDSDDEIERVVPLISLISALIKDTGSSAVISVDTYKPTVAEAALQAGARIINDVSGLRYPELATIAAKDNASLVIMHTKAAPKERLQNSELYRDVVAEVKEFFNEKIAIAKAAGLSDRQIILDPGPDFSKTPLQTIQLLRATRQFAALGYPLLYAISHKDFIGALTKTKPRERSAGTLAALAFGVSQGAGIFRVHDVKAAADFLKVYGSLTSDDEFLDDVRLTEDIRYQEVS